MTEDEDLALEELLNQPTVSDVVAIHDQILETERGLSGFYGVNRLAGALGRIDSYIEYGEVKSLFEIAAMYIESIAMGHCFADANKRTALSVALVFLDSHGYEIQKNDALADLVEALVKREVTREQVANVLMELFARNCFCEDSI